MQGNDLWPGVSPCNRIDDRADLGNVGEDGAETEEEEVTIAKREGSLESDVDDEGSEEARDRGRDVAAIEVSDLVPGRDSDRSPDRLLRGEDAGVEEVEEAADDDDGLEDEDENRWWQV
ncbi:hypothetical protein BG011_010245 [Mortierella polycephala]|uniref:Uncharacterized protein n=1 Tax=Mortierella polycephala TaxID=41804 RepID=A0A9P6Q9H8_9FUNG|nr:hypothetical protein BG011_010245 [Mortierella polycephala]